MRMRSVEFVDNTMPCDTDYTDNSLQFPQDVTNKGQTICPNIHECRRRSRLERIHCSLKYARLMALHITGAREKGLKKFMMVIRSEKKKFLRFAPRSRYWILKGDVWEVAKNKKKAVEFVLAFARIILNGNENNE